MTKAFFKLARRSQPGDREKTIPLGMYRLLVAVHRVLQEIQAGDVEPRLAPCSALDGLPCACQDSQHERNQGRKSAGRPGPLWSLWRALRAGDAHASAAGTGGGISPGRERPG